MSAPALRTRLARRLPFYYGWTVFAIASSTSYTSRPLMSVAVLAVFVVPMTEAFGWSRGLFAGAVSLGGLCAVAISPVAGRLVDRYGAGLMIGVSSALAGACAIGLSAIASVWTFYALYVPGRMVFAGPLELAPTAAISNWFVRRRAFVLALFGVTQGTGLAAMPFIAQLLITGWGWRSAWTALGMYTLAVGVVPALVLMARRPEDMGVEPDPPSTSPQRSARASARHGPGTATSVAIVATPESHFTLAQALRTRAFWVLSVFSAAGFMVQAGVSLHQVSHYIDQGLPAAVAALSASIFALAQVPAGLLWSALVRHLPVRVLLALSGLSVALGTVGTALSVALGSALLSTSILGIGVGGLHFLLRLAWADYYGRQHIGAIRGMTLPVQIGGQAIGPVAAGAVFDLTGGYHGAFVFFASAVTLASLLVLAAVPPRSS
jgi:OFA family oxalate/formate antiporter-like MFS transporter